MTTAIAKAKSTPNLPANIQEFLSADIANIKKRLATPTGDYIRVTSNKTFQLPGLDNEAEAINVVIVDWVQQNALYKGAYREGVVQPALCIATGEAKDLAPWPQSPEKQNADCQSCPKNKYPEEGGARPCKNSYLLAVLPVAPDLSKEPLMLIKISSTGMTPFEEYVNGLRSVKMHPMQMVTELTCDPKPKYQSVRFRVFAENTDVQGAFAQREAARARLMVPPNFQREAA